MRRVAGRVEENREKDAVQAGLPPFPSTTIFDLQLTIIDESLQNSSIFEECLLEVLYSLYRNPLYWHTDRQKYDRMRLLLIDFSSSLPPFSYSFLSLYLSFSHQCVKLRDFVVLKSYINMKNSNILAIITPT